MGPLSGTGKNETTPNVTVGKRKGRHSRCQDSDRCVGPGCRVSTGKTDRRYGVTQREV